MKKLVTVYSGEAITTSLKVAEVFGKSHKHVLKKIDAIVEKIHEPKNGLMQNSDKISHFFTVTTQNLKIGNGAIRDNRIYTMTRDGFTLLAMGFTGAKALQFKLAYINAFNEMEATIKQNLNVAKQVVVAEHTRALPASRKEIVLSDKSKSEIGGIVKAVVHAEIEKAFTPPQSRLDAFNFTTWAFSAWEAIGAMRSLHDKQVEYQAEAVKLLTDKK